MKSIQQIEEMIKNGEDKEKIKEAILVNPKARGYAALAFANQGKILEAMLILHHPELYKPKGGKKTK